MSSCELNLGDQYMYVCMYVYEDSNSGFFRLPNLYVYAHKWLEHQLLGQHFRFRISPCVVNAAISKFLSKMDVFGTFFFGIKVR